MKIISNAATLIGLVIAILGACCLDSPGAYGYIAGAACIVGGIIAGTGYALRLRGERRERRLDQFHQVDRLDGDAEWIELEEVKRVREKKNGTVDKRTLRDSQNFGGQLLPTKHGFVQMVFRENRIVNGCVSTKK